MQHAVRQGEWSTYFGGYIRSPINVITEMLRNLFLPAGPGGLDRILDFSGPVTGALFFAPSVAFVEEPPGDGRDSGVELSVPFTALFSYNYVERACSAV
ncbi:hypothetical protein [Streptomyces sp. NPDC101149]|uniref:hypothetical protein n=1 Tax=Streptomyces sp. NPDC101149 TaxID=3366113 RepID=UPI0038006011